MARIQSSFLHFYLFRARQHNTSLLLTSKDELKYPRGLFPKQPKLLSIRPTTFPLKNNSKPSPQIFRYIQRDVKVFHLYLILISKPPFQISQKPFSKTKIKPHSRENSTNQSVLQYHKILKSILWGIHKISSMTNFLEFSRPLSG